MSSIFILRNGSFIILEKAVVHEIHETVLAGNPQSGCSQKTRTNSNAYPDLLHHPLGALLNLCSQLFSFVNFVPLRVDAKRHHPC